MEATKPLKLRVQWERGASIEPFFEERTMTLLKAGDLLSLLQLAVALNLAYGGISYFIDSEMERAKLCVIELKSLFNSEPDPQIKLHYGSVLLLGLATYSRIQIIDKRSRPAVLVVLFAILAAISLVFLMVATWMAQEHAPSWLVAVSMLLPIVPSGVFVAVLVHSTAIRKHIQALMVQVSALPPTRQLKVL
jgi:RsiW-degrading membrane proteinase PrsW (M82 family)